MILEQKQTYSSLKVPEMVERTMRLFLGSLLAMLYACILITLDCVARKPRQLCVFPDDCLSMIMAMDQDGISEIAYKIGKLASLGAWVPSRTQLHRCSTKDNQDNQIMKIMKIKSAYGPFIDPDLVCVTIVLDGQKELLGLYAVDDDNEDSRIVLKSNAVLVHDYRQTAHFIDITAAHRDCSTLTLYFRKCKMGYIQQNWNLPMIRYIRSYFGLL